MSNSFTCPFCNKEIAKSFDTYKEHWVTRDTVNIHATPPKPGQLCISYYTCPNCKEISIIITVDSDSSMDAVNIRPRSLARKFPDYIPKAIRNDYEEACAIVNLSPKSSAALARRCLQGMIRDFFHVTGKNLYEEIDAIKPHIPSVQWTVLDGVRQIGNIGAHMEKDINLIIDIEPDEAQKLIKLIELLLNQWYIERHEQEQLYADIIGINGSKQSQRKKFE